MLLTADPDCRREGGPDRTVVEVAVGVLIRPEWGISPDVTP